MMEARPKRRSILKTSNSIKRVEGHLKWDETNLEENEQIKASFEHTKITEPKTPYHSSTVMPDEDMEPLDLEGDMSHDQVEEEPPAPEQPPLEDSNDCLIAAVNVPQERQLLHRSSYDGGESFQERRRSHYNMAADIKVGKQLAEQDLHEAEEEERRASTTS